MLRLTPLEETIDGKELLQNDRIKLLKRHIRSKFSLPAEEIEAIATNLTLIDLTELESLFEEILEIETIEELESWIEERLPEQE
jgi:hypothetical protein